MSLFHSRAQYNSWLLAINFVSQLSHDWPTKLLRGEVQTSMCLLGLSFVAPDRSSWFWPGKMSYHSDNLLLSLMNSLPSAIFCPDLDHPQYGSVKIIAKNVGGKAEYKCNDGYKLYGASFRKCLYSGVWSSRLPTCKRN